MPIKIDGTHLGAVRASRADLEEALGRFEEARPSFLALADDDAMARQVQAFAAGLPDWVENVVVLGIGGSALAGRALVGALGAGSRLRVRFCDSIDPVTFERLHAQLDPAHTLWNVISKSGTTLETSTLLTVVWDQLTRELGPHRARQRVVVTTDAADNPLRALARSEGLRTFDLPVAVGGRFTVLTPVGLVPAALAGIDVQGLLAGAREQAQRLVGERDPERNPALVAAGATFELAQAGRPVLVLWPYGDALVEPCEWARQLWAEGTAKASRGVTALVARGAAGQHAELQAFCEGPPVHQVQFLTFEETPIDVPVPPATGRPASLGALVAASQRATADLLDRRGTPSLTIIAPRLDAHSLGALTLFWEVQTVLCALLMGVDPFGEPAVEEGKRRTSSYL
jgi:glucose-6-phosphate isomerase